MEAKDSEKAVEVAESPAHELSDQVSDSEAVEKIGVKPTIPRTLTKLIGLIGVNSSVVCPWPTFFFIAVFNLANGGTGGLIVGTIVACIFMGPVYISLAEKLRRYPTAGGQYHWVAALAPPQCRKFLSFFTGCLLAFTWLTFFSAAVWQTGLCVTAIVTIYTGEYEVGWSFAAAIVLQVISFMVNITWGKHMNYPEMLVVVLHIVTFLLLVGLLGWANANGIAEANFSFTSFTGWSPNFGVCISIVYGVAVLSGFDCASHIAEDTIDAAKKLPRSLLISTTANKISCLIIVVMISLTAGNVNALFEQPLGASGHPLGAIIQLTYNAAQGSKSLACAPFGMILPIFTMCCINTHASASRMIFSFVRDDNNPFFHKIMAKDLNNVQIPRVAIAFAAIAPCLILWINFVSAVGFQAIASQVTLSLSTTYFLAIGCSLYSRIYQPDLLGRKFTSIFHLGTRWGMFIDITALCFLAFAWVIAWFPYTTPVDAETLNYAPIIDAGVAILGSVYYFTYARYHYKNPAPDEIGNLDA